MNIEDFTSKEQMGQALAAELAKEAVRADLTLVFALIDNGATLEERDPTRGSTPLISAAEEGHVLVVAALLEKGADTEATNGFGDTALALAEGNGFAQIATMISTVRKQDKTRHGEEAAQAFRAGLSDEIMPLRLLRFKAPIPV